MHKCTNALPMALLATLLSGLPNESAAGTNDNAKILIHLLSPTTVIDPPSAACQIVDASPSCEAIQTAGALYPPSTYRYAYLLVTDGSATGGIAEVSCSIDYDAPALTGVYVFDWTLCATAEFPVAGVHGPWPAPLSSNRLVWDPTNDCQQFEPGGPGTGVVAVGGYFSLEAYSLDDLAVIANVTDGLATVTNCAGVVDTVEGQGVSRTPSHLGFARFSASGHEAGYSPCGLATPAKETTWGRIKKTYL